MAENTATNGSTFILPNSIPVVKGPNLNSDRSGTQIVAGFIPVGVLLPNAVGGAKGYKIPYYDSETQKGYQRELQEARCRDLARSLLKGETDLPTAILLNIRGENVDVDDLYSDGSLHIKKMRDGGETFYVVDGQHRVEALRILMSEKYGAALNKWKNFQLPFVCMLGAPEEEEMTQFHVVNANAKSVRTDLSGTLLKRRDEADYLTEEERDKKHDALHAQGLMESLASNSRVWKGLIRLPNAEKGDTLVASAGITRSLASLTNSPTFRAKDPHKQIDLIDAFWEAVSEVLPEAFEKPHEHSLQKGIGVWVMHDFLAYVLEKAREAGLDEYNPETYRYIIQGSLQDLSGPSEKVDGEVQGSEFWRTGKDGAVSGFSSAAGKKRLVTKLCRKTPSAADLDNYRREQSKGKSQA